jgi:hypothetical protein
LRRSLGANRISKNLANLFLRAPAMAASTALKFILHIIFELTDYNLCHALV